MAGAGAGGAGMAVTGGMAFGGNAMATPQTFSSSFRPPSGHGGPNDSCCGGGGGGGAYDLRALEREEDPDEDMHACLGVDVGTSTIKVGLFWSSVLERIYNVRVCHSSTTVRRRKTRVVPCAYRPLLRLIWENTPGRLRALPPGGMQQCVARALR